MRRWIPAGVYAAASGEGIRPAPTSVSCMYQHRKQLEADFVSSHRDATRFYVMFLHNDDLKAQFRFVDPANPHQYDPQVTLRLACLFALQGIPCGYYGTEQGSSGRGMKDESVPQAHWGRPGFDATNLFTWICRRLTRCGARRHRSATGGSSFGQFPEMSKTSVCRDFGRHHGVFADSERPGNCRGGDCEQGQTTSVEVIVAKTLSYPSDVY
jgi:glycosidase